MTLLDILKELVREIESEEVKSCADYIIGDIKVTLENMKGELLTCAETIYALHGALYEAITQMRED